MQFCQNLYMIKKESLPDRPKFCRSMSAVRHLFWRLVISTCQLLLYQEIYRSSRSCHFSAGVEASVTWHTGFSQWQPLFVDSRKQIARSQNRSRMCEIHQTKLSCAAQQVGIVHFYAVTDIKVLSCHLWWMREWRNLLTSTHVGLQVCHTGSRGWRVTKIFGPRCKRD